VAFFRARGTDVVEELEVTKEDVRFMLPKAIRQALAAAP
jgi:4-hydroxy-3-methylbut-2-enyl diphosphate reductase